MQNLITSPLSAFTVCLWIRTSDVTISGTPLSYSAKKQGGSANEILLHDYQNFVIDINGDRRSTNVSANDGKWHHFCFIWQNSDGFWSLYKDGQPKVNGTGFKTGYEIKEGGVLVLGQEQDSHGGGFQTSQSFIGELANSNMWSYVLNANKILQESKSCAYGNIGDLLHWHLAIDKRTGPDVQEKINPTCV